MVAEILSEGDIREVLRDLDAWTHEADSLRWKKIFGSFAEAFAFTSRVALLAEKHDHHPDIALSYTRLELRLTTHDAGGVTARDIKFARALDAWS